MVKAVVFLGFLFFRGCVCCRFSGSLLEVIWGAFGDFGELFGVLGGAGNRRRNTRFLVDLRGPCVGPEMADPPPNHQ